MFAGLMCLLLVLQIPFPRQGAGTDTRRMQDQSFLSGQVTTKSGEPIPLATISVLSRADASRADQREGGVGWPGTHTQVRRDGTFRVAVPGGSTFEVCATVPAKPKQCRTVDVESNDLAVVTFTF